MPWDVHIARLAALPIPHGTEGGYTNRGCRCVACRSAMNVGRNRRRIEYGPGPNAVHGKNSTYSNGCRCDECRRAHTEYWRERRLRRSAP